MENTALNHRYQTRLVHPWLVWATRRVQTVRFGRASCAAGPGAIATHQLAHGLSYSISVACKSSILTRNRRIYTSLNGRYWPRRRGDGRQRERTSRSRRVTGIESTSDRGLGPPERLSPLPTHWYQQCRKPLQRVVAWRAGTMVLCH